MAIFTDDFNRADEALETSANWTKLNTGVISIVSNVADAGSGVNDYRCEAAMDSDDHYAEAVVVGVGNTSVCCRWNVGSPDTVANASFYMFRYNAGQWQLYRNVSNTFTLIDSLTESEASPPYTIRIEADGSTIRGLVNGVEKCSVTDTGITGNLRTGIKNAFATSAQWDDFEAGDLAAGPLTVSPAGSITATATLTRATTMALTGAITAAGATAKATAKSVGGAITATGTVATAIIIALATAGSMTATATLRRATAILRTGSTTPAGTLAKATSISLTGAITTAGAVSRLLAVSLGGAITAVGTVATTIIEAATTFWTKNPVAFTPADPDDPSPW